MTSNSEAKLLSALGNAQRRVSPQDAISAMARAYSWDYRKTDIEDAKEELRRLQVATSEYINAAHSLLEYHADDDESE